MQTVKALISLYIHVFWSWLSTVIKNSISAQQKFDQTVQLCIRPLSWHGTIHFDNSKNQRLLAGARGQIQSYKLHCCIWRDLIKLSIWFSLCCLFFVSKGNLLDFYDSKFVFQLEMPPLACFSLQLGEKPPDPEEVSIVFSSPEPKAQGELLWSPTVHRHRCPSVRPFTIFNNISS